MLHPSSWFGGIGLFLIMKRLFKFTMVYLGCCTVEMLVEETGIYDKHFMNIFLGSYVLWMCDRVLCENTDILSIVNSDLIINNSLNISKTISEMSLSAAKAAEVIQLPIVNSVSYSNTSVDTEDLRSVPNNGNDLNDGSYQKLVFKLVLYIIKYSLF
jgi:hypothetical protein